jgi:hypothetical protein
MWDVLATILKISRLQVSCYKYQEQWSWLILLQTLSIVQCAYKMLISKEEKVISKISISKHRAESKNKVWNR